MAVDHMRDYFAALVGVNPRKLWAGVWERIIRSIPRPVLGIWYAYKALRRLSTATEIVKEVAQDPSTRNLDYWTLTARETVSNPQWGENMYRALAARVRAKDRSPETALALELAYLIYKRKRG